MNVFSALRAQVLVLLLLASVLQAAKLYGQITRKSALLEYLEFCDENPAVAVDPVRLDRTAEESYRLTTLGVPELGPEETQEHKKLSKIISSSESHHGLLRLESGRPGT